MNNKDSWNPEQYKKFEQERNLPFYDLVNLIEPKPSMTVVDLGCGTGKLTKELHNKIQAKFTLGIDVSDAMLKESKLCRDEGLEFAYQNISSFYDPKKYDLIFSNAALQWVPDHLTLFQRLADSLKKDGQIAIQVPANFDYPTHFIAYELAREAPFVEELKGETGYRHTMTPEEYSKLLYNLGFKRQLVRLQVYPHLLESTEGVIEWVKGSLLTYYQSRLPPQVYDQFLQRYREKIFTYFGDSKPFFMPFKRMLLWGSL